VNAESIRTRIKTGGHLLDLSKISQVGHGKQLCDAKKIDTSELLKGEF
jgi:hypothetical protein